jgi:hypothetical protein
VLTCFGIVLVIFTLLAGTAGNLTSLAGFNQNEQKFYPLCITPDMCNVSDQFIETDDIILARDIETFTGVYFAWEYTLSNYQLALSYINQLGVPYSNVKQGHQFLGRPPPSSYSQAI